MYRRQIVLAGYSQDTKFRFAGGRSPADATPTGVGTRKRGTRVQTRVYECMVNWYQTVIASLYASQIASLILRGATESPMTYTSLTSSRTTCTKPLTG